MRKVAILAILAFFVAVLGGCGTSQSVVDPSDPSKNLNPAMPQHEKDARLHGHPKSAG